MPLPPEPTPASQSPSRPTTPSSPATPVTPVTPARPTKSAARGSSGSGSAAAGTSTTSTDEPALASPALASPALASPALASSALASPALASSSASARIAMKRTISAFNRPEPDRLLSVQSHVVSGYVGNRSATFPLQLLGWDVDVINTVQFSNHTGYGRWQGLRFDEAHVRSLFAGLEQNGLLKQSRMLSGYMPSPGVVSAVHDAVHRIRQHNPHLVYLCDPVMGDMGRGMYVDAGVLPIYRSMLPLTTIITPNQFEAQSLAGMEITSRDSLVAVLDKLHALGATHVLITSVNLPPEDMASIGADADAGAGTDAATNSQHSMILVGSSRTPTQDKQPLRPWFIQFPEITGYFSGVGDLFAAMTLGRFLHGGARGQGQDDGESAAPSSSSSSPAPAPAPAQSITPIAHAAEVAIAAVQAVLQKTLEAIGEGAGAGAQPDGEGDGDADADADADAAAEERVETMRRKELRIVQSRREIEAPVVRYRARFFADGSAHGGGEGGREGKVA